MADPKIKYDIEAAVQGTGSVDELASALQNAADVLEGDLQASARSAARALDGIGAKQRALQTFVELKRQTQELSGQMQQAAGVVDAFGARLQQAGARNSELAAAEKSAAAALEQARQSLNAKREALKAVREQTQAAARRS